VWGWEAHTRRGTHDEKSLSQTRRSIHTFKKGQAGASRDSLRPLCLSMCIDGLLKYLTRNDGATPTSSEIVVIIYEEGFAHAFGRRTHEISSNPQLQGSPCFLDLP
jgi:hypothetical protein